MIQLQPDIIMMRLVDHLKTSNALEVSTPDEQFQNAVVREPVSRNLVAAQYNIWTSSAPWIRLLFGHFEYQHCQNFKRGKWRETIYTKYRLPSPLSQYQLALWAIRPLSGWWINLDIHRSVSYKNEFFTAIRVGDLAAVQSMIAEKKAFVTDRAYDHFDYTGLHVNSTPNFFYQDD
jgi:hypothetical protein